MYVRALLGIAQLMAAGALAGWPAVAANSKTMNWVPGAAAPVGWHFERLLPRGFGELPPDARLTRGGQGALGMGI